MLQRPQLLLCLLVLGMVLPFLNKPVHIDDTFVLHITGSILENPFDPFAGDFDWFGHPAPVWRATTNPPLVSYWVAPVAAIWGYREGLLHLAVVPFYLLLAWGMFDLSRRFVSRPWVPTLFFLVSAPFLVSGNLMRDIPAAALGVAGMALLVRGIDSSSSSRLAGSAVLLGLSVLAKYSMGVLLPVAAFYAVVRRRPGAAVWLALSLGVVGIWCLHTLIVYGDVHPIYLLRERSSASGILWQDKAFSGLAILGSSLYVQPLLFLRWGADRRWKTVAATLLVGAVVGWWAYRFYDGDFDAGFQFWMLLGTVTLLGILFAAWRERFSPDIWLLIVWVAAHLVFSVFFVPFQAVRHLIAALPPVLLLTFRCWEEKDQFLPWGKSVMAGCLLIQLGVTALVAAADYEYADTYRRFAVSAAEKYQNERIWYVGHWGWKFYAEQAGFTQLHRDGPDPNPGDLLIWPAKVHVGDVFQNDRGLRERFEELTAETFPGKVPVRTMSTEAGAGFYATIRRRLPYRFGSEATLEQFRVYRVGSKAVEE